MAFISSFAPPLLPPPTLSPSLSPSFAGHSSRGSPTAQCSVAFWTLPDLPLSPSHPSPVPPPCRTLILRQPNSTVLAFWALPALVFKTIIIDIFFILYKVSVECVWKHMVWLQ